MKYISICSGIEAATVAFHGFGWTPLAFSEIEAFPSAVLAARWPQVPNLGDMTKFAEWPEEILAECDLLVGGPPCQAFSVAGLRKSLDDDRGNITLAYVRLLNHIDEVRKRHGRPPAIAVYENVPGLLSTKDNAFGCLIGALAGCDEAPETETGKWPKAGYVCGETRRVGYRILDAQFFGVAQRRRRIFLVAVPCELVASLGDNACPSEILSLRESVRGNPPTRSKAWEGAARSTAASLTSSGRDSQDTFVTVPSQAVGFNWQNGGGYGKANDGLGITEEGTGPLQRCNTPAVAFKPGQSEAAGGTFVTEEFAPTMQSQSNGSTAVPAVSFNAYQRTEGEATWPIGASDGRKVEVGVRSGMQVRRLTPSECEYLQGFPAGHTDIVFRKKPAADGPRYRALGNSMAVPCMVWLGHRIQQATKGDNT